MHLVGLLQGRTSSDASSALVIITMALILMAGFLMTRITKRLRLPNVTAYIVAGILIGPFGLDLIPASFVEGTQFLPDIALAFIAFGTGEYFRLSGLKKNGVRAVVITLLESLLASALVFAAARWVLRLQLAFSAVLAALASATAPASTMMTIRQTHARGDFVDTLLQVVALDDVVGLVAYSVAISIALAGMGSGVQASAVAAPIAGNLLALVLGGVFGWAMKWMLQRRSTDNRLIVAVALLFGFCGLCAAADISPLLGCMAMGTVYINTSGDEKLFRQLGYFSPPLLLLFFVRSGVSFDLSALGGGSASVGMVPLAVVGVVYFAVRIAGKYVGALLGCMLVKKPARTSRCLGLALIPQAGVAIGLAAMGARTLGGDMGNALQTIILASSVLYELIGPACAKLALYLSGSYSNRLEDAVTVAPLTDTGQPKTAVQLLVEQIQQIQQQLPKHEINEEERAFTEAAEEQYAMLAYTRRRLGRR